MIQNLGYTKRSLQKLRKQRLGLYIDRCLTRHGSVNLNRCWLQRLVLRVHLRNALDLLGLILTVHLHLVRWCVKGILRVLYLVELPLGLVQLKLQVVKLVL